MRGRKKKVMKKKINRFFKQSFFEYFFFLPLFATSLILKYKKKLRKIKKKIARKNSFNYEKAK